MMSEEERNALRQAAANRVRERYSWDAVTALYENLFRRIAPRSVTPKARVRADN